MIRVRPRQCYQSESYSVWIILSLSMARQWGDEYDGPPPGLYHRRSPVHSRSVAELKGSRQTYTYLSQPICPNTQIWYCVRVNHPPGFGSRTLKWLKLASISTSNFSSTSMLLHTDTVTQLACSIELLRSPGFGTAPGDTQYVTTLGHRP